MLETQRPTTGLLFGSFLFRSDLISESELIAKFESLYGEALYYRPAFNPLAEYYAKEMGEGLKRIFLITSDIFPREYLLSSKLAALEWERGWSRDQKRFVNVDTGFLSAENFLLATTKNYAHRVFIGQNLFADLTYQMTNGQLECFPWTYPDYRDEEKMRYFSWARQFLLQKLKSNA